MFQNHKREHVFFHNWKSTRCIHEIFRALYIQHFHEYNGVIFCIENLNLDFVFVVPIIIILLTYQVLTAIINWNKEIVSVYYTACLATALTTAQMAINTAQLIRSPWFPSTPTLTKIKYIQRA